MSEDYKVQWSIKVGQNYMDMINVRGDSVDEVENLMLAMSDRAAVMSAIATEIQAKTVVTNEFPTTAPASNQPTNGDAKVCAHGVAMLRRSGISKAGKAYAGWFCSVKNDPNLKECAPIFDRN